MRNYMDVQKLYEEIEKQAAILVGELIEKNWTITTAESCTGGMIAAYLVDVPGVSSVFEAGYITYANRIKEELLRVPSALIAEYGVVSLPVVCAMAEGAAKNAGAQVSVSVSGIAGPDGGTAEKPVGLVCIGRFIGGSTEAREYRFDGSRKEIRLQTTLAALCYATEGFKHNSVYS